MRREKVKLLFVLTRLRKNGAVLNLLSIVKYLDRSRFEPTLFLAEQPRLSDYWEALLAGIQVVYGPARNRKTPGSSYLSLPKLLETAKKADLVIGAVEGSSTYLAIVAAKLVNKVPAVLVQNSLSAHLEQMSCVHRHLSQSLYPQVKVALVVSDGLKENLEQFLPRLKGRVRTVYNLIEVGRVQKLSQQPPPTSAPNSYILAAGRLSYQKGFDLLIRAYAKLRARGFTRELVILGEGPERARLQSLASELGVAPFVAMPGFQENPYPWMRGADLFVSSSRYEGFCRVIAEALAVGTPVVATDCASGPAEVLQGGACGVLVPPERPSAIADAVWCLLRDEPRSAELRARGLERAKAFAPQISLNAFEGAVMDTLSQHEQAHRSRTP